MLNKIFSENKKLRSFGIIEVMIASVIIILVLSSAVVLSSSSVRLANKNDVYSMAAQISDDILEQIVFTKSLNKASFISDTGINRFPVECFSTILSEKTGTNCASASDYLPKNLVLPADTGGFEVYKIDGSTYPPDYFRVQVSVKKPSGASSMCQGSDIPGDKCRYVRVEVKWTDAAGDEKYDTAQYFSDWEN